MERNLAGKTALVTGGSRGLGQAIAEKLAAEGALVAVNYAENRGAAEATVARITAAGGSLLSEPADRIWGVRMFQFNDLDGFKLGVSTPLAG